MNGNILLLEDDPDQSETVTKMLLKAFPNYYLRICETESEFYIALNDIPVGSLFFAVLDAMVPWCEPAERMPVPPTDVQRDGIRYAGKRSLEMLRKKHGADIPVWIYSILNSDGHGVEPSGNTHILEKRPENGELLRAIHQVIQA